MFSQLWFWLFIVSIALGATIPKTNKFGSILSALTLVARFVFVVLMFFNAPHWWWGLVLIAEYMLVIAIVPRVNPDNQSLPFVLYSVVGSYINPIIVLFMYLSFFR